MESMPQLFSLFNPFAVVCAATLVWAVLSWVWLKPKRMERLLRQQGLSGNSYRLLHGDLTEYSKMKDQASLTPIHLSDDICPRVLPFQHRSIQLHGKNSFVWMGTTARVNVMEPKLIRDVLANHGTFQKLKSHLGRSLVRGLIGREGDQWVKHRKITSAAFHTDKLKDLLPVVLASSEEMLSRWDEMLQNKAECELDPRAWLENLTGDVISRAAFGSNFEEGRLIFKLLKQQFALFLKAIRTNHIPGWRFLPTETNRKMIEVRNQIHAAIREIVNKREVAIMAGKGKTDDLLGTLLKSNADEIEELGGELGKGMSLDEVIEECKLFYIAGQETTRSTLLWTLILLSHHQEWQNRAREEVLKVFGKNPPDNDGLNQLKIVGMILNEVLRLYPPVVQLARTLRKETKLGEMILPPGVQLCVPILLIHRDAELWGEDAHEFKPERFCHGISNPARTQLAFLPFSFGPRVCLGQSFAMIEAKAAVAMILQRYWFQVSRDYVHAPWDNVNIQPQHGAPLIVHKL